MFFNTYKFSLKSNEDLINNMKILCIYIIRNLSIFTVTLYILIIIVWEYDLFMYFTFSNSSFEEYQNDKLDALIDKTVKEYSDIQNFKDDEKEVRLIVVLTWCGLCIIGITAYSIFCFRS